MSIYKGAVNRPVMTSLCFVAVLVLGLFSLKKLPIDLYPNIETNTIMVMTSYQGASASDIENNVSRPLENVLNTVSNLKHITSKSRENISVITLEFDYGKNIDELTNDVRDKLDLVKSSLPDGAENPTIFKFSTDMVMMYIKAPFRYISNEKCVLTKYKISQVIFCLITICFLGIIGFLNQSCY